MNAFLKLHEGDNVQVALRLAPKGTVLQTPSGAIPTSDSVAMAHKVADRAINKGDAVIKYGMKIGVATAHIPAGAHVHVHNIASDYTATIYHDATSGAEHD